MDGAQRAKLHDSVGKPHGATWAGTWAHSVQWDTQANGAFRQTPGMAVTSSWAVGRLLVAVLGLGHEAHKGCSDTCSS